MIDVEAKLASSTLTPMMRQYLSVKAAHPEAVILFRMGDFFEAFYDDAETCARLLDITLTRRSKEAEAPPMAGVPHHAIEGYIARLIDLRKTVVLVDQVEDPKKAKGLVRREVTRIITPGTYQHPESGGRVPLYLVAINIPRARARRRKASNFGLAALDLSTGELRATTSEGEAALVDELARLGAKELVVEAAALEDPLVLAVRKERPEMTVSALDELGSEPQAARSALRRVIGEDEYRAVAELLPKEAVAAAGFTVHYAETTQLRAESKEKKAGGTLCHIRSVKPYIAGDALILDASARRHLELFESVGDSGRAGTLFGVIDHAVTAMGGRLLARWLARPLISVEEIRRRHRAVGALVDAPFQLDLMRERFRSVHDLERILSRLAMGRAGPKLLASIRDSLGVAPELFQIAAEVSKAAALELDTGALLATLSEVDRCADVAAVIEAAIVDSPPTDLGGDPVFRDGYHAELDELVRVSRDGKQLIADLERRERERTRITSLKVKYNKVFGYFIEVTKANLSLVPKDYVRKQTTVNSERYFTEELKGLEEKILGADSERSRVEGELFAALLQEVTQHVARLAGVADALKALDALLGLAETAQRSNWACPQVDDGDLIEIDEGRHPVLETLGAALGEPFVPNDLRLGGDARLALITGPNMAGKSTIMRQTALLSILAQMGSFVPAARARFGVVDRIFTRVGASDDLTKGRSTFMVEMTETASILRSAGPRSLILLDEIGRGTSTFDGLSIAWAVAEHIHDSVGAKTLFATHYHELTELCRDKAKAVNLHVAVKEWNQDIVFLRKLLPGPMNRSYGVHVARLAGLPQSVVKRAHAVLDTLEAHELSTTRVPTAQLGLFHLEPPAAPDGRADEVLDAIRSISVDDTTPRAALDALVQWQTMLGASTTPAAEE